jgi:hypothetical protein
MYFEWIDDPQLFRCRLNCWIVISFMSEAHLYQFYSLPYRRVDTLCYVTHFEIFKRSCGYILPLEKCFGGLAFWTRLCWPLSWKLHAQRHAKGTFTLRGEQEIHTCYRPSHSGICPDIIRPLLGFGSFWSEKWRLNRFRCSLRYPVHPQNSGMP